MVWDPILKRYRIATADETPTHRGAVLKPWTTVRPVVITQEGEVQPSDIPLSVIEVEVEERSDEIGGSRENVV